MSSHKLFPTVKQKLRKVLWFHVERGGFFIEESMATTGKRSTERNLFSQNTQLGRFWYWRNSGIEVLCNSSFAIFPSLLSWHDDVLLSRLTPERPVCYCVTICDLGHITSTKNSPAFPTAMRRDWRDAVSSGGTEESSRPGGAPGADVDRCGGWGGRPGGP